MSKLVTLPSPLVIKLAAAKIIIIGVGIGSRSPGQGLQLVVAQDQLQGPDHVLRNFVLDGKNALEVPVVTFRLEMIPGGYVYQLNENSKPVSRPPDTAFEQGIDMQFAPDFTDILSAILESQGGGAGSDSQYPDSGQGVYDFFRHSVAEIFLLAFAAEVGQRQHGY